MYFIGFGTKTFHFLEKFVVECFWKPNSLINFKNFKYTFAVYNFLLFESFCFLIKYLNLKKALPIEEYTPIEDDTQTEEDSTKTWRLLEERWWLCIRINFLVHIFEYNVHFSYDNIQFLTKITKPERQVEGYGSLADSTKRSS